MSRHFLRYWISKSGNWNILDQAAMTYSASNQYNRVSLGDEIWAVVQRQSDKHLILVGRMTVDWIGNKLDASKRVNMRPQDMWDADIYVTCDEPEPYGSIDINQYADKLRFISNTNDSLDLDDGVIRPQQLQTMRELASESVSLLRAIWYDTNEIILTTETFTEGQRKLRVHIYRERSQSFVSRAKHIFKQQHGRLFCEVCGFDFTEFYGSLGEDFIEAHHREPLSEIEEENISQTVDNLAMVCANCHRMLHRVKPWLTVEQLRSILHDSK